MKKRIDSQFELIKFIQDLRNNNINIPENVTLEIDSKYLKNEIILEANNLWNIPLDVNVKRFNYMGEKITFKTQDNEQ